ncbi:MAG: hypothetical protein RML46_01655 [Anaerolineae bacterium]|nr:hypothetical protein [Anaerolineae bacterium]
MFQHLKPFLKTEGLLFGSTLLGQGVEFGILGQLFMGGLQLYMSPGARVLYNRDDRREDLGEALAEHFEQCSVYLRGTGAFFVARRPKISDS